MPRATQVARGIAFLVDFSPYQAGAPLAAGLLSPAALFGDHAMRVRIRLIALLTLAVATGPSMALQPAVHDNAHFFKPDTVQRANETIREIKRATTKDLQIETFASPPVDGMEQANSKDHQV